MFELKYLRNDFFRDWIYFQFSSSLSNSFLIYRTTFCLLQSILSRLRHRHSTRTHITFPSFSLTGWEKKKKYSASFLPFFPTRAPPLSVWPDSARSFPSYSWNEPKTGHTSSRSMLYRDSHLPNRPRQRWWWLPAITPHMHMHAPWRARGALYVRIYCHVWGEYKGGIWETSMSMRALLLQ